nr:hypothetical protein [Lactococcus lactis]
MINIFTLVGRITRDLELRYRRPFETYKKEAKKWYTFRVFGN